MSTMNERVYIGIDPGANGAMAIVTSYVMGLLPCDYGVYRSTIAGLRAERPDSRDIFAIVEDVHAMPMNGCKGNFMLGWSLGRIQEMLEAALIPYQLVKPQKWQGEYGISNRDKSKSQSIATAKRLFPDVNLRRTERCTKDHDGFADALLMAEYGRRHSA